MDIFLTQTRSSKLRIAYLLLLGIAIGVSGGSKTAIIPLVAFHVRGLATLLSRHV